MFDGFSYSKAAVERAMKVQEVMLRAWAKKISWWQPAPKRVPAATVEKVLALSSAVCM